MSTWTKYNERYEHIAPENMSKRDDGVKKQKIGGRNNKKKNFMSKKDKEMEKLKRLEMERERRQKLHITLPDEITVGELALKLKIQSAEIVKRLMMLGEMKSVSDVIDYDTAALVAMEIGAKVEKEVVVTIEDRLFDDSEDKDEQKVERPTGCCCYGTRRPRQDLHPRRNPPLRRHLHRGGRHHPAYRAPTVSRRTAGILPSSTRRAMRPLPPCARAAPR